jgi:hypothetical protein
MILAGADPSRIDIIHHLVDSPTVFGLDLSSLGITKHVVFMWLASAGLIVVMNVAARQRGLVPRGFRNFVEPILLYLRDEVAVPNLGAKADKYLPYLWTVFFFVLFCNLLGLVPGGATATGNLSVTAGLALISMFCIHFIGVREKDRRDPREAFRAGRATLGEHDGRSHHHPGPDGLHLPVQELVHRAGFGRGIRCHLLLGAVRRGPAGVRVHVSHRGVHGDGCASRALVPTCSPELPCKETIEWKA